MPKGIEAWVPVESLVSLYERYGIITELNDGKIVKLEKEKEKDAMSA